MRLPRLGGAIHADDLDHRSRHREVGFPGVLFGVPAQDKSPSAAYAEMPRSDSELASYLDNLIPRQVEILNHLARIPQQERERALHQARQPLAAFPPHDRLAPDEIGYVGWIDRVTARVRMLQQDREIRLFHKAVMSLDPAYPRGDLSNLHSVLVCDVRD